MPATAEYLAVHPFASPDIVNPPEAPTYRYRPDVNSVLDLEGVETATLSEGSRIDILIDNRLASYVLQDGVPTGSDLEVVPDDYDVSLNQQYWFLAASDTADFITTGSLNITFADIGGTLSLDQLPPGSLATVDSIGENALYFYNDATALPSLVNAAQVASFLSGSISFSDLIGTLSLTQFPAGTVVTLDSIDEDGFYFFNNSTFLPELIGQADALSFLLPDQTGNDGKFLKTVAGVLSWATASGGSSAWGTLTGTLSDQTDLQSALNAKQPLDSDLTTLAGLTATTDNFVVSVSSAWASRTPSQVRTTLALVIGTNVQAWDADLDAVAALTTDSFGLALLTKTSAANIRTYIGAGTSSFSGAFSALSGIPTTLSGYGITDAQPLDSDLTTIAGLTATTDNFIVSVSSAWSSRTPSQVRTTLGLVIGTNIQAWDADLDTLAGLTATTDNFIVSVSSAWASRTPAQVLATLAAVGTTFQPLDSDLTTIAGLTATTDNFIVSVSSAWASRTPTQVRSTLGLVIGTNVQAWDADLDTLAGLTATTDNFVVSVSSAWASRTPTQVKTTLGLTIGTNVQAWDADLDTIAGLTATTDNFIVSVSSAWSSRTPSQVRTTLGLVIGTNVQAWDADLDTWAGVTPASGIATFLATPSSANLRSAMTDEIGTGACVFDGATLVATLTFAATGASLAPFNIPGGGSLQTTPNDGDVEADANCFYGCTDAGNRGYIPIRHVIRADSTVTQANDANAHAIFTTPANGRITLETGCYLVHGMLAWSSMSATSGNISVDLLGAGTATIGSWLLKFNGVDGAANTVSNHGGSWNATSSSASPNFIAGQTATTAIVEVYGTFEVTGGGTLIPTQTLTTAAAAVLAVGSHLIVERIGSTSLTSIGQWD